MGMAGLMSPTSGAFNPLTGAAPSSPMGLISSGAISPTGSSGQSMMPTGASSQPTTASQGGGSGLIGTGSTSSSGSATSGGLLSGFSANLMAGSPTGGTVTSNGQPTSSAAGSTTGATASPASLSTALGTSNSGVASNNGGDLQGTIGTSGISPSGSSTGTQTVPTIGYPTGYNVAQGVNTSPTSLLPTGAVSPTNLGTQQQVNAPTASSVVASNPLTGPTNWNVTANQTLAGQYANLMQTGNPTIQAAEQQVIQANALHGGNNNLMTQTAATMQGSQLALQIAAQDAATQATAAQYNATAANNYASQLNQFTANAALSSQNFQQGVGMLNAQTNQQFQLMAGQINAAAYTTSMSLNASLASTQANLNATMQTMDKQFTQNVALMGAQSTIASQQAYQQYGMNVRLGYLSSISQQQAALMTTIASIQGNPNITSAQAQGGVANAVNEFNTFVTQMGAYASAMMASSSSFPSASSTSSSTSSSGSTVTTSENLPTASSVINASTWPSMGTSTSTGAQSFIAPQSVSSGSIIPSNVATARYGSQAYA